MGFANYVIEETNQWHYDVTVTSMGLRWSSNTILFIHLFPIVGVNSTHSWHVKVDDDKNNACKIIVGAMSLKKWICWWCSWYTVVPKQPQLGGGQAHAENTMHTFYGNIPKKLGVERWISSPPHVSNAEWVSRPRKASMRLSKLNFHRHTESVEEIETK